MAPELWLGPDVNRDLLELTAGSWPVARMHCAVVQGYIQQLWATTENQDRVGPNYYPRLAGGGYYAHLGLLHAAEGPGLKDWDTDADGGHRGTQAAQQLVVCLDRIRAAGSDLRDESLDSSLLARVALGMSFDAAADAVAHVIQTGRAHGLAQIGLTEAYPKTPYTDSITFADLLDARGAKPSHLHLDMDVYAFVDNRMSDAQVRNELQWLQAECAARGMAFGVIINGGRVRSQYREFALNTVRRLPVWFGTHLPDRLILQSFEQAAFPPLVPETDPTSHTGLLVEVHKLVGGSASMTWADVKVLTTPNGTVLQNEDGTVRSLNPATPSGGPYHWETRPAGADGGYEICTINGGTAVYSPVGESVVFAFQATKPGKPGFGSISVNELT
jgi:hypothetical protein